MTSRHHTRRPTLADRAAHTPTGYDRPLDQAFVRTAGLTVTPNPKRDQHARLVLANYALDQPETQREQWLGEMLNILGLKPAAAQP